MSINVYTSIPIPVGDGTGAPASVTGQGLKTFVIGGSFDATVTIEGGINGDFSPLFILDKPSQFRNIPVVVDEIRVRVSDFRSGSPQVIVGGEPATNVFGSLAVPAANGTGAALDTSLFGKEKTLIVGGVFDATLTFEVSEDVAGPWAPLAKFDKSGNVSNVSIVTRFMRVKVTDYLSGVPTARVGSADIGFAGVDTSAIHDDVSGEIAAVGEKLVPVAGDLLLIEDSEDTNSKKRVQIANLPGGGGGGWEFLDKIALGAVAPSVEFNGAAGDGVNQYQPDGDEDIEYQIVCRLECVVSLVQLKLKLNGDVGANYHCRGIQNTTGAILATSFNDSFVMNDSKGSAYIIIHLLAKSGLRRMYQAEAVTSTVTGIASAGWQEFKGVWSNDADNITRIALPITGGDNIFANSEFYLFRRVPA